MKDVQILGVDLGKNSCSVVGLDAAGQVVLRRRMRRDTIIALAAKLPGCVVAMEACCGAHHLGRVLVAQGHEVRLMSPEYVRPYVKAQKNDDRDAEAIAEAATRPTMRFVALKSEAQLDVQSSASRPRSTGGRTHFADESDAQHPARTRNRGCRRDAASCLSATSRHCLPSTRRRRSRAACAASARTTCAIEWRALDPRIAAFDDEFAAHGAQ